MPAVVITAAAVSPFSMAPLDMVNPLDIVAANARTYSQSKARRVESDSCDALQVLVLGMSLSRNRYPLSGDMHNYSMSREKDPRDML